MSETPIEDFIREAAVLVEKDGETYFEVILDTVYELERRFTAERRRADEIKAELDAQKRGGLKTSQVLKDTVEQRDDLQSRLQEAESTARTIRDYRRKDQEKISELEKEAERLKGNEYYTGFQMGQEHEQIKIKELEASLEKYKAVVEVARKVTNTELPIHGCDLRELRDSLDFLASLEGDKLQGGSRE